MLKYLIPFLMPVLACASTNQLACNSWNFKAASCDTGVVNASVTPISDQSGGYCMPAGNWFTGVSAKGTTVINVINGCRGTFGIVAQPAPAPYWLPLDSSGWSVMPTSYTKSVYVDSSAGLDSNTGADAAHPVKSLQAALNLVNKGRTANSSVHVFFKRGGDWSGQNNLSVTWGGYGAALPVVLDGWSYGAPTAARPLFTNLQFWNANYIAVQGLQFKGSGLSEGMYFHGPSTHVLIEDVVADGFWENVIFDSGSNVVIRRSQFINAWDANFKTTDMSKPQGLYIAGMNGAIIEDNVFDHNGYHQADLSDATMFAHDLYISNSSAALSHGVVFRNNLVSNGLQSIKGPASGVIAGNLFYSDGNGGYIGSQGGSVTGNVFMANAGKSVKSYHLSQPAAVIAEGGSFGIDGGMSLGAGKNGLTTFAGNLVLNVTGGAFATGDADANFVFTGNTIVGTDTFWGFFYTPYKGVVSNNLFQGSTQCQTIYHSNNALNGQIAWSGNSYYCASGQASPTLFTLQYSKQNWAQYLALSKESGAAWKQVTFVNPSWTLDFPTFLAKMKARSKFNWSTTVNAATVVSQALAAYQTK